MKSIDIATVLVTSGFFCAGMSLLLIAVQRSFRNEVHGLGMWATAQLCLLASAVLSVIMRGQVSDLILLPIYNGVLLAGFSLQTVAMQRFYDERPTWHLITAICGMCMAGLLWWLVIHPDFNHRVSCFSFAEVALHLLVLRSLARHGERHPATYACAVLVVVQSLIVAMRGILSLTQFSHAIDLASSSTFANAYICVSYIVNFLMSASFIALAARKVQVLLLVRATVDSLTGALNRHGLEDWQKRTDTRRRTADWPLSILAVDIDHFKRVNDVHGHAVGDKLLTHVASVLRITLREHDVLVRMGGEEFVIVLPGTGAHDAQRVAERLRELLRQPKDGVPRCTVSIGIASRSQPGDTLSTMLADADSALYAAKHSGRDRAVLAPVDRSFDDVDVAYGAADCSALRL